MKITHYASGSTANAIQVDDILIDAGVKIESNFKTVLVTHAHIDHIRHLKHALERCETFYTTDRVLTSIKEKMQQWGEKRKNETLELIEKKYRKPKNVESFELKHDLPCIGYLINNEYVHMSDTGVIKPPDFTNNKTFLTIDSNYDLYELETSGRPLDLITRIQETHMSNEEAMNLAKTLNPKHTMFVHLSKETNHPDLAKATHDLIAHDFETYYPQQETKIVVKK